MSKLNARDQIRVGIDRIQIAGDFKKKGELPDFDGFEKLSDRFVRSVTPIKTWERVARYEHGETGSQLFILYRTNLPSLPDMKATLIAPNGRFLSWNAVDGVRRELAEARLVLIELALDFPPKCGIDRDFILKHGVFGKAHRRPVSLPTIYFGGRRSDKLIRCYFKAEVVAFRVEFQLHASWLTQRNLTQLQNLPDLPMHLAPYLNFSRIDWTLLRNHLEATQPENASRVLRDARARSRDILRTLSYLTSEKIFNRHRYLQSLSINRDAMKAVKHWAREWVLHV